MGKTKDRMRLKLTYNPLFIAQVLFMVIFTVVLIVAALLSAGNDLLNMLLADPVITVQFVIACSLPFCYLVLKSIRKQLEKDAEMAKIPLLLLMLVQFLNMNLICAVLLVSGIWLEYGKNIFTFSRKMLTNKKMWVETSGAIGLFVLACITLTIRIRLNMF